MQKNNMFLLNLFTNISDTDTCKKVLDVLLSDDEQKVILDRVIAALMYSAGNSTSDIAATTESSAIILSKVREELEKSNIDFSRLVSGSSLNPYSIFAEVYDSLTEDVEYKKRADYISSLFKRFKISPEIVLDLGCGTGSVTTLMAKKGYSMIGVDMSPEMLSIASDKAKKEGLDILYLNQPMEDFELYGTVGAVICLLDSLNYITENKDLSRTFDLVHNYLDPNGLFIFDVNTPYKFKNILAGNTFCGENEHVFYTWENFFDPESNLCEFMLNFFIKEGKTYSRYTETHYQKSYTSSYLKKLLEGCGFELLGTFDDLSFNLPARNSQKVFYVARKIG